jgi:hypothetical protein
MKRLAFVRNWLGEREVYVMDVSSPEAESRPAAQVTWLGRDEGPTWSPGGERLTVLHRRFDGEQLLQLTPAETTQLPVRVTDVAWLDGRPAWSSSGINYGTPLPDLSNSAPSPLYVEDVTPASGDGGEPWDLVPVVGLRLPTPAFTPY